ncbi:uncharacterized protein [Lepeophtheirus salmonis]|uniref:uncharacterized protein n=1 Tax=Lepeophtheirus salmonis TaxID=72036 RepID=UPI001AE26C7D|nr:centrosomal and chromosomal factor-like [Lepeophtheirus salmonis]
MLSVIHPGSTQQSYLSSYENESSPMISHHQHPQARWFNNPQFNSNSSWGTPSSSVQNSSYFFQTPGYSSSVFGTSHSAASSSFNPTSSSYAAASLSGSPYTSSSSSLIRQPNNQAATKDYSKQLFVDCSIEYELPNAPKVPKNSEPILMIHPDYSKRKAKSKKSACSSTNPCPVLFVVPSVKKSLSNRASTNKRIHTTGAAPPSLSRPSRGLKRSFSQAVSSEEIMLSQANFMQHQLHFNNNYGVCYCSFYNTTCSSRNPPLQQLPLGPSIPSKRLCTDISCLEQMKLQQQQILQYQQHFRMNLRRAGTSLWA